MAKDYGNIDSIWIWDNEFRGIGYQGLITVNTKTYVDEPKRTGDGSIPNINDHDTFVVPRAKINFKLLNIEDYQRLCRVLNMSNEFPVRYFDKQFGKFVTHYMYIEPLEMSKLFNVGTRVIGVLDYEVSFIGTLNNLEKNNVVYYLNLSETDSSILSEAEFKWGESMAVLTGEEVVRIAGEKGFTLPSNKSFNKWNTKRDGTGISYVPSQINVSVFEPINLYAQWE